MEHGLEVLAAVVFSRVVVWHRGVSRFIIWPFFDGRTGQRHLIVHHVTGVAFYGIQTRGYIVLTCKVAFLFFLKSVVMMVLTKCL